MFLEPLLTETKSRYVIFPIQYNDVWSMYKKHVSTYWTVEEIDLSKDMNDWNNLKAEEQHFIKDKTLIDIIDNIERLVRALRKHIIRKDVT